MWTLRDFRPQIIFSGFRRGVNEICALLEFYTSWTGSFLWTFRDILSVASSRVKAEGPTLMVQTVCFTLENWTVKLSWPSVRSYDSTLRKSLKVSVCPLKIRPIGCPETSVISYRSTLRKIPKERRSRAKFGLAVKQIVPLSVDPTQ